MCFYWPQNLPSFRTVEPYQVSKFNFITLRGWLNLRAMLLTTVFPSSVLIGLFTESCFQVHIDFLLKAPSDMSALGICTFFCIKKKNKYSMGISSNMSVISCVSITELLWLPSYFPWLFSA